MADNIRRELIDYLQSNGQTCLATLCQDGRPLNAKRLKAAGQPKWDKFLLMHGAEVKISTGPHGEIMLSPAPAPIRIWPSLLKFPAVLDVVVNPDALHALLMQYQTDSNEILRLAFVGDARLSARVAQDLCRRFPAATVGQLTKWRTVYTSNYSLAAVLGHQELTCIPKQGQLAWHREGTFVEAALEKFELYQQYCDFIEISFHTQLPPRNATFSPALPPGAVATESSAPALGP
jgi:hypothetical protein